MGDYAINIMWEHDYGRLLKSDTLASNVYEKTTCQLNISGREFLYGGRTETISLFSDHVDIKYLDFCSLYPYICKYGRFPQGHPERISKDFNYKINAYYGVIKATVVPPTNLFISLLPYRSNGKLMFPLCASCCEALSNGPCQHNDEQRSLTGAWISVELYKGVELGYKILKIHDVWHYKDSKAYQRKERNQGLFSSYMDTFLEAKQKYSGFPKNITSMEEKQRFCTEFYEAENIQLDPNDVSYNAVRRMTAKLCLNSLWGKFAENQNKPQTIIITQPRKYLEILNDESKIVTDIFPINDEQIMLIYHHKENYVPSNKKGNIVLAAFVTSLARLKLYSVLEKLQKRVMYMDTDSVIFKTPKDAMYKPKLGNYLSR